MDEERKERESKPIMLWSLDGCHWNVPTEGLEKCQPCGHLRPEQCRNDNWNVSRFGRCAKHLRVMFGGSAFQLSSGKEHGIYLSAGIYLGKQEHILPPHFIGAGILSSSLAETMRGIAKPFRSVGFPKSFVCVSAEAHGRSCFCVNKPAEPALGWEIGTTEEVMGQFLRAIISVPSPVTHFMWKYCLEDGQN